MKNRASEMRARAEKLRQDAHDKGQARSAKATELDHEADAVMDKAKGAEPSDWPPSDLTASSSSEESRTETRPSKGLKRAKPSRAEESEPSEAEPED
jgi:hypothetical protein